jgi:membrane protein
MSLWTRAGLSWRELLLRIYRQIFEDALLGHCAELAYYFLFSIFPLLLFLTTLLGYLAQASDEVRVNLFTYIARISPSVDVTRLLSDTLAEIAAGRGKTKLSLGLFGALWVASNGMSAVGGTLNSAYGFRETRRWWKRRLIALLLTVVFAALLVSALVVMIAGGVIGEALARRVGLGPLFAVLWRLLQWPLIFVFLVISFEIVYNYAPNVGKHARREWWTPGAITGVVLWLGASYGLRLYLVYVHTYSRAYGGLGGVILLLVWFYLTGFAILMGGEVNSEIARALDERAVREGRVAAPARGGRWLRRRSRRVATR